MKYEIDFDLKTLLHDPHREVFEDKARFKVVAAGRRFGKSYLSAYVLLRSAYFGGDNKNYYYIAPTIQQARDIVWAVLKAKALPELVAKTNESRLEITFINGSKISLKSAERYEALRGVSLSGCVLDEVATFRYFEDTWQKVIRPSLSDQKGFAFFISSPSGRNHFFDLYNNSKVLSDWSSYQFTTIQGGYVDAEEIDAAKTDLDPKTFRQEYEATFISYEGLVVPNFSREEHFELDFELREGESILMGSDINVMKMASCMAVYRDGVIIVFDEFYGDADTPSLMKSVLKRYRDRHITCYPDSSSGARSSLGIDTTNKKLYTEAFDKVRTKSKNPLIETRVNAFNSMVKSGDGTIRFKVTPNCKLMVETLEKHSYDPKTGKPDKTTKFDDPFDAMSYLTLWYSPLTKTNAPRTFRR